MNGGNLGCRPTGPKGFAHDYLVDALSQALTYCASKRGVTGNGHIASLAAGVRVANDLSNIRPQASSPQVFAIAEALAPATR
jgi:hypothetical protein